MKADCWRCRYDLVMLGDYLGVNEWAMPAEAKVEWLSRSHVQHSAPGYVGTPSLSTSD